jgi:hypothetical protein
MKKLLYLLISVVILSSCSDGLYSHYPKVKKKNQFTTVAKKTTKKDNVEMPSKKPVLSSGEAEISFISLQQVLPVSNFKPSRADKKTINENKTAFLKNDFINKTDKLDAQNGEIRPQKHKRARQSLVFSLVGWGAILLSLALGGFLLFGIIAFVFEIIALSFGVQAMREMKNNPGAYINEDDALAGVIISSIYLCLVALTLIILFAFLLVLIAAL